MTVITYLDKLKDEEEKDEAFEQASWATGSARDRTYFISNYLHVDSEQSIEVDRTALDILDSVLISAESFIRVHKQREKNQMEREAMARGNIVPELDRQFKKTATETKPFLDKRFAKQNNMHLYKRVMYMGLLCNKIGDTRQKVWIKFLKETNLGVVRLLFNP